MQQMNQSKARWRYQTPLNHAKQLNCVLVSFNIWREKTVDNTLLKLKLYPPPKKKIRYFHIIITHDVKTTNTSAFIHKKKHSNAKMMCIFSFKRVLFRLLNSELCFSNVLLFNMKCFI